MWPSGCTRQFIGHGQTHVLYDIVHGGRQLGQRETEALLQEIFEDLIEEQNLIESEGMLGVKIWANG